MYILGRDAIDTCGTRRVLQYRSNDPNESFFRILMANRWIAEIDLNDKTDDQLRISSNPLLAQVIQNPNQSPLRNIVFAARPAKITLRILLYMPSRYTYSSSFNN
jgi:hypothetical protein